MLEHTQSVHVFQSKDVEDYTKLLKNYQTEERKEKWSCRLLSLQVFMAESK